MGLVPVHGGYAEEKVFSGGTSIFGWYFQSRFLGEKGGTTWGNNSDMYREDTDADP